ncbi:DUF2567 domain-containing protein [Gordonia hankookensis]|uniref:DUF2567 domain-containing protein n=1 Tax=Gordonia hankookensis TaxID=589403 RepID=A0ABR7W5E6_9ACTN|nr:DUF2567 domain-containing protein [Gordonia hankookensis]MBD1318055.1 DUF2567 domain-containing protein [Gordonia hankookensis]
MTDAGRGRAVGPLIAVIGVVVLLGSVVGMIWAEVTPAMSGRVVDADSALIPAGEFPEEFAGVGTFALLLFGYGVVAVVIAWFASRRWRGPLGFGAVVISTVIGSLLAAWVGTMVADWRFDDPRSSPVGSTFEVVPDLWLDGAVRGGIAGPWVLFVSAPLAASLVYLGLALASRHGDLGVGDLLDARSEEQLRPTAQPM